MIFRRWRKSILIRVTGTAVLLSMIVIGGVGTFLANEISNGIYDEKVRAVNSEALSLIDFTQVQLDSTRYRSDRKLENVVAQIFQIWDVNPSASTREAVLLSTPKSAKTSHEYQGSTYPVSISTIPESLRQQVRSITGVSSQLIAITFNSGQKMKGIAVGKLVEIPPNSEYELYYLFPLVDQDNLVGYVDRLLIITGLILALLIGLITWYVTRKIVNPVREAAEIAEELTAGDLGRRLVIRGDDEMGRLAIAFNEMALSLQQQISRLENLSRLQQRFVSDVSHELRTPLTTIRMASQVIYDARENLNPAASRSAELLIAQVGRFETLLTDLLEVSRFDARAAILETTEIDMTQLVRQTLDHLHVLETHLFKIKTPDHPVFAIADARRIERILRNLISNAIDHSDGKGVEITIAQGDAEVAVGVRDYGIGFSERESERLCDRFWRADPSRSRIRGGTGLGLSIALDDAKLHQGTLLAWGRLGMGANFVITLPKNPGIPMSSTPIDVVPYDIPSTILGDIDPEDI